MQGENWLLKQLSDVFNQPQLNTDVCCLKDFATSDEQAGNNCQLLQINGQWFAAIAALEDLLSEITLSHPDKAQQLGVILTGPCPLLSQPIALERFYNCVFTPEAFTSLRLAHFQLPAAKQETLIDSPLRELPLLPQDPIVTEKFCLVFTQEFNLAFLLGKDNANKPAFHFTFEPTTLQQLWSILRSRLILANSGELLDLEAKISQYKSYNPSYKIVTKFTTKLLKYLPQFTQAKPKKIRQIETICVEEESQHISEKPLNLTVSHQAQTDNNTVNFQEMELLQALTHEIRTPLTTIRTLTRLLLKRKNLDPSIAKHLESIDRECTEQINRMELIFRAAELGLQPLEKKFQLVTFPLEQLFTECIPNWEKQAKRRNVNLKVLLPNKLPKVISDPGLLNRVLTGVIEKSIRSLSRGGNLVLQVNVVGDRLKLEFRSECASVPHTFKSLGQLLMLQPETGGLSLNLQVTKNLFNLLGGKLTVRQKQEEGEVLTVFLPLNTSSNSQSISLSNC